MNATVRDGPAGRFITVEGIDGAGKSTHLAAIVARWTAQGFDVLQTREPGGTPLAEALRALLLHQPMDALTEALLVFAARRDHLRHCIEPALSRGAIVLCDRFTDASFAYQGAGKGVDAGVLDALEQAVQRHGEPAGPAVAGAALRRPDLTLWFDLAPAIAASRLAAARAPDRFERQDAAFFQRVADGYRARHDAEPQRIARIDAALPPDQVLAQITACLRARGW